MHDACSAKDAKRNHERTRSTGSLEAKGRASDLKNPRKKIEAKTAEKKEEGSP